MQPHTTYRVYCWVSNERVKGLSYEVAGEITDAKDESIKFATCVALMANASALAAQQAPADVS